MHGVRPSTFLFVCMGISLLHCVCRCSGSTTAFACIILFCYCACCYGRGIAALAFGVFSYCFWGFIVICFFPPLHLGIPFLDVRAVVRSGLLGLVRGFDIFVRAYYNLIRMHVRRSMIALSDAFRSKSRVF